MEIKTTANISDNATSETYNTEKSQKSQNDPEKVKERKLRTGFHRRRCRKLFERIFISDGVEVD